MTYEPKSDDARNLSVIFINEAFHYIVGWSNKFFTKAMWSVCDSDRFSLMVRIERILLKGGGGGQGKESCL